METYNYNTSVSRGKDVHSPLIWNVKRWSQEQVDFALGLAQKHGYRTAIEEREGRRDLIISGHGGDLSEFWRELDDRYPPTIYYTVLK